VNATRANVDAVWAVWGGTCRIAAKRLTLTGGAYRATVRLPDRGQAATSRRRANWHNVRERGTGERRDAGLAAIACRIAASLRSQAVPIV